jgi:diaminopimelate epimerase
VLWNADGGRAEISGNGIRCLGQAIIGHLGLDHSTDQRLWIETDAGTRQLTIMARTDSENAAGTETAAGVDMVRVGMGKALPGPDLSDRWPQVGVEVLAQRGVDIGNPHLVAFVDQLGDADMAAIGPVVEADYPSGLNVHLVEVTGPGSLNLRVWERGAGVTQACGSGACAAAWAANADGRVGPRVTVTMPGGSADVELTDDEVFLIGPAVRVGQVILDG